MASVKITFLVPTEHVKKVKTALENEGVFDRKTGIKPHTDTSIGNDGRRCFLVPSTIEWGPELETESKPSITGSLLARLGLSELEVDISFIQATPESTPRGDSKDKATNPLHIAASQYLQTVPAAILDAADTTAVALLSNLPTTYTIYGPLLLLPPQAFKSEPWQNFLRTVPQSSISAFYEKIAATLSITHIAINAPIAAQTSPPSNSNTSSTTNSNILRHPTSLLPLHGPFGPPPTPQLLTHPTTLDFTTAFWTHCRQNSIHQSWAPLYTMFSRGNIAEKARLLRLPSITLAIEQGKTNGKGSAAIDLYAGIGYFAFCYRKAGVKRVVGWEINPWSVEGLKRGAGGNGWGVGVVVGRDGGEEEGDGEEGGDGLVSNEDEALASDSDFIIFRESNAYASARIRRLRSRLPPIRHVNCGLLPTSRGSWGTAVEAVDPILGGWIHLHENLAIGEIEKKAEEIVGEIDCILRRLMEDGERDGAKLEHVERVKTYAPGVMHCVLDIHIPSRVIGY